MRVLLFPIAILSSGALGAPAFALQASDTMQAWKASSGKERSELLEQILGKTGAESAKVSKCMDETSTTPGHADLPIGEVAKVCASQGLGEQPV